MDGVINLYKDRGMTSRRCSSDVKRLLDVKKCGHVGTLDPLAEGVLPISIGYGTKFADYISSTTKVYETDFELGKTTDSFDVDGSIVWENDDIHPTFEEVERSLERFCGDVELTVSGYSAKKINGKRAYQLARNGLIVDAGSCRMRILSCELLSYEYPHGRMRVECAKGTYIRSIVHEMGLDLGCGAIVTTLLRTRSGKLKSSSAVTFEELKEMKSKSSLANIVIDVIDVLDWPKVVVKESAVKSLLHGASPDIESYSDFFEDECENYFILSPERKLLAFGLRQNSERIPIKVVKVLAQSL